MKRLVLCCDGSFQNLESYPTNVVKIAQATQHRDEAGVPQVVYYDAGVGSSFFLSGVFGWGVETNIHEAYQFLCLTTHRVMKSTVLASVGERIRCAVWLD